MSKLENLNRDEILKYVKEELIYKKLNLEGIGVSLSDIKDDTNLFESEFLELESIEVLEIAIGIQQKFNVKIENLGPANAKIHFQTPNSITDFILSLKKNES